MVIKVDLACEKCRKKIKKVLCKTPQIQNQVYDEKANTVTITVVCCCPQKVKQKICCEGGKTVKCIKILPPPPVPLQPPPRPPPPSSPPCCRPCCMECYKGQGGGPYYYQGCGRPVYCSWSGGGWYVSRCDYLCEENTTGCTIM